jgi:hypothetical protein
MQAKGFLTALVLLAAACQGPERLAGGASETEATIAGRILGADGKPAAGVLVRLRPADFLQDTASILAKGSLRMAGDTRTDANGAFAFDSVYLGEYSIEATAGQNGVFQRISVNGNSDRIELGAAGLSATSFLQGRIVLPPGATGGAFVQVYGLEKSARADSAGAFRIPGMPGGLFSLKIKASSPKVADKEVIGVFVAQDVPADLGEVGLANAPGSELLDTWADSARVKVDTRGIKDTGIVAGYPLLIRLNSSNFDFTRSTGLDLRFSSATGSGLAYEVERWDPLQREAEVWVRVDTLRPDDSTQYLKMYWNKPGAPGQSSSSLVFDTADGYMGVWHLQRTPGITGEPLFPDASGEGNSAKGFGLGTAGTAAGTIGEGLELNGKDQAVYSSRAFTDPNTFSLSLWFRAEAGATGKLAGFGSQQTGASSKNDRHLWIDNSGILNFGIYAPPGVRKIVSSAAPCTDGKWHHVTARLSPQGEFLFVDGAEAARDPAATRGAEYAGFWRFGYDHMTSDYAPRNLWFKGALDELRVSGSAWSPFRIRLDYETQKPESGRVRIERM